MSARRKKKQTRRRRKRRRRRTTTKKRREKRRRRQTHALLLAKQKKEGKNIQEEQQQKEQQEERNKDEKNDSKKKKKKNNEKKKKKKKKKKKNNKNNNNNNDNNNNNNNNNETASRTLFKTHRPDPHLKKISQPDTPLKEKKLGVRFPSILLFQASKHRRGAQPFFERSCTQIWTPPSQNGPNRTPPPPHPPGLATLYTYTQPRPSAGFRNILIQLPTSSIIIPKFFGSRYVCTKKLSPSHASAC